MLSVRWSMYILRNKELQMGNHLDGFFAIGSFQVNLAPLWGRVTYSMRLANLPDMDNQQL
jgi:hypothetical protein